MLIYVEITRTILGHSGAHFSLMIKNAKHISLLSDTETLFKQIQIALNLLEIPNQGAIGVVKNKTKRPRFITEQWTIIVHEKNLDTLENIIELIDPTLKYEIKDGYFVERRQRRSPHSLNV